MRGVFSAVLLRSVRTSAVVSCGHAAAPAVCLRHSTEDGLKAPRKPPTARRVKPSDDFFADAFDDADTAVSPRKDPLIGVPEEVFRAAANPPPEHSEIIEGSEETELSGNSAEAEMGSEPCEAHIEEKRQFMREQTTERLIEHTMNYLRSTNNSQLVDEDEEDVLFPVVAERYKQCTVDQLLDVVAMLQARSTLARYGTQMSDLVRDRIVVLATRAVKLRKSAAQTPEDGDSGASDSLFVSEEEEGQRLAAEDPILADAAKQITPDTVLRSLLVMSTSARRKRDLDFFHVMGAYFAFYVNHYKDPHDLVKVLTALARAKILPPKSFLNMLGRRFPVLCKNEPLETLPSYRAMVNFSKMGHEHMNIYRFLSNHMLSLIESSITEQKRIAKVSLRRAAEAEETAAAKDAVKDGATQSTDMRSVPTKVRFHEMVGVKPSMFTKWLFILAKNGAPHQQYLRPLVRDVILPMLPYFPPPSFTRLLSSLNHFKCDDTDVLEPVIDFMCGSGKSGDPSLEQDGGRTYCPTRADLFVILTMLGRDGTALPSNVGKYLGYCGDVFLQSSLTMQNADPTKSKASKEDVEKVVCELDVHQFVLRPGDMCSIARHLVQLQRRVEIPLEDLEPMMMLMGHFARRLLALMELGVVSTLQVDDFVDLCKQQHYADVDGSLERLAEKRRDAAGSVDEDGMPMDEDSALDIDVRETFFKIVLVNDAYRYVSYRPLPGALQVDFREALTKVSATDLMEAIDLYERCFPTALKPPVRLLLTRSFVAKFCKDGEEVISPDGSELVLRPPTQQFLTRKDLLRLVELVRRTTLEGIQQSSDLRAFLSVKANRLGLESEVTLEG